MVNAFRLARDSALAFVLCVLTSCTTTVAPAPLPPQPQPIALETESDGMPRTEVLDLALQAYRCGEREGQFMRPVLTIIDFSVPANEPRLWVIDVHTLEPLHHDYVAHGERSGDNLATEFSNDIGSHQSSLGLFRTDESYVGAFGYSLRLSGLEPGINDNARERAIVIHGMSNVGAAAVAEWGTIGRSWGCPALPEDATAGVIDNIAGGSAIFAYYPDVSWLRDSHYLHCDAPLTASSDDPTVSGQDLKEGSPADVALADQPG